MPKLHELLEHGKEEKIFDDEFYVLAESNIDNFVKETGNLVRRGWCPYNNLVVFDEKIVQLFRRESAYKDAAVKLHAVKEAMEDIGDFKIFFGGRASLGKALIAKIFKIVHGIDEEA